MRNGIDARFTYAITAPANEMISQAAVPLTIAALFWHKYNENGSVDVALPHLQLKHFCSTTEL